LGDTKINRMKTLEEQIAGKCRHFNGVMNDTCKIGIAYKDIRSDDRPFRFPCIDKEDHSCSKAVFLTPEEVHDEVDQIKKSSTKAINVLIKVKSEKKIKGFVPCDCGGKIHYALAPQNSHVWAKCDTCDLSIIE
jgi:hypothetical protein